MSTTPGSLREAAVMLNVAQGEILRALRESARTGKAVVPLAMVDALMTIRDVEMTRRRWSDQEEKEGR